LEGAGIKNVGIFLCRLKYIKAIWYILWKFGKIAVCLVYFFPLFGKLRREKSGNPAIEWRIFFASFRRILRRTKTFIRGVAEVSVC
jgi:hypothetical protein